MEGGGEGLFSHCDQPCNSLSLLGMLAQEEEEIRSSARRKWICLFRGDPEERRDNSPPQPPQSAISVIKRGLFSTRRSPSTFFAKSLLYSWSCSFSKVCPKTELPPPAQRSAPKSRSRGAPRRRRWSAFGRRRDVVVLECVPTTPAQRHTHLNVCLCAGFFCSSSHTARCAAY